MSLGASESTTVNDATTDDAKDKRSREQYKHDQEQLGRYLFHELNGLFEKDTSM
jgi:hypothetical protein